MTRELLDLSPLASRDRKITITVEEREIVEDILERRIPDRKVLAFGSRVEGEPRRYSDLDLAVLGEEPLGFRLLQRLADDFSNSDLTWRVDVVDWATTSPTFREIIERTGVVLRDGASRELTRLRAGMPIPYGGAKFSVVTAELAGAFRPGDRLVVVQESGDLLRVPGAVHASAGEAIDRAGVAFVELATIPDAAIGDFFERFALKLAERQVWREIEDANAADVVAALAAGHSTARLAVSGAMRRDMVAGLRAWRDAPDRRGRAVERVEHDGWSVEQVAAPLGVVGFVFEGRPNVFADAVGVIRGGNTAVFRIGSGALRTARAIETHALAPALSEAGLPAGAAVLLDSAERSAGWALFSDPRLALAVARGSGPAVAQLGAIARQAGTPVSLHGTGGAWLIADGTADAARFVAAVSNSIDRKVCNTLNVCCIVEPRADDLVPLFREALKHGRVHLGVGAELATEWEWEETPDVWLAIVPDLDAAVALFNAHSPRFIVSLISEDPAAHDRVAERADAAFVGDGFTRWVDGQYAYHKPELGLSNWQGGRLFARGGVLSGDGVFTLKTRMRQRDMSLRR